jgi:hypothetical protein
MVRRLGVLITLCLLLAAGCASSPEPTSTTSRSVDASARTLASARELRTTLTQGWPRIMQSLKRDVITLPEATTCDVYVRDPQGSMQTAIGGKRWSRVLFAVYQQAPDDKLLAKADRRVHLFSAYGSPLHRLSGANWAIWSAYRPALLTMQKAIGGELVQLYEREKPVTRDLKSGEHVALRCGLSLVVPPGYDGYYAAGMSELTGELDAVAPQTASSDGLLYAFSAQSLAPGGEDSFVGPLHWPLVARSVDGTTEVRCVATHIGTPDALALIAVVVRLPGRPIGLVRLDTSAHQASDDPGVVMSQVRSVWARFEVAGAEPPTLEE